MRRWIDPSKFGWWCGDHHIHAAGCAHYTNPTEGVLAPDMARHCHRRGFESRRQSHVGPVLRLPKAILHRPRRRRSRSIPICSATTSKSAASARIKAAIFACSACRNRCIPAAIRATLAHALPEHAALGEEARRRLRSGAQRLGPGAAELRTCPITSSRPSTASAPTNTSSMSRMKSRVRMAALVPAVDFMSTVDTPPTWELNIWYHTLNCRLPHPHQRRDRFPVHLRRARRPGPQLRQARRAPRLTMTGAKAFARALLCGRWPEPPHRFHRG